MQGRKQAIASAWQVTHILLLLRQYDELLEDFSSPLPGSQALKFDTKYPKPFTTQFRSVYDKYWAAYWRMPEYNGFRFFYAISVGLLFGAIFWRLGYVSLCVHCMFGL